jgi:hypothetical protein
VDRDEEAVEEVVTKMVTLGPVEEEAAAAVDGDEDVAKEVIAETVTLGAVEEEAAAAALAALSQDVPPTLSAGGTQRENMRAAHARGVPGASVLRTRCASFTGALGSWTRRSPCSSCQKTRRRASNKRSLTLSVRLATCAMLYLVPIFYLIHTISRV